MMKKVGGIWSHIIFRRILFEGADEKVGGIWSHIIFRRILFNSKLSAYEAKLSAYEGSMMLELAIWKSKIAEQTDGNINLLTPDMRMGCRIDSLSMVQIILPDVLSFLRGDGHELANE